MPFIISVLKIFFFSIAASNVAVSIAASNVAVSIAASNVVVSIAVLVAYQYAWSAAYSKQDQ